MTKKETFDVIANVFATVDVPEKDEVLAFIEKEKAAIDAKNVKAKERAAAKRAEGDALRAKIEDVLTDEPMTINDIIEAVDVEGLTPAKVVARMRQLVAAEKVAKESVNVDGRKLVAYVKA